MSRVLAAKKVIKASVKFTGSEWDSYEDDWGDVKDYMAIIATEASAIFGTIYWDGRVFEMDIIDYKGRHIELRQEGSWYKYGGPPMGFTFDPPEFKLNGQDYSDDLEYFLKNSIDADWEREIDGQIDIMWVFARRHDIIADWATFMNTAFKLEE